MGSKWIISTVRIDTRRVKKREIADQDSGHERYCTPMYPSRRKACTRDRGGDDGRGVQIHRESRQHGQAQEGADDGYWYAYTIEMESPLEPK
jgi:hypothetical protein